MDDSDNDPRDIGKEFERRKLTKGGGGGKPEGGGATGVDFIKLHVPPNTLKKYAEILKMRMPLRVRKLSTFSYKIIQGLLLKNCGEVLKRFKTCTFT